MEGLKKKMDKRLNNEEKKILEQIATGTNDDCIADEMGYSRGTVRSRILKMFGKTGSDNRYELITWGFRNGYLK